MSKGFDEKRNTFTQYYGSKELDAALLMMPLVGFLLRPISGSRALSPQSRRSCWRTGSYSGIRRAWRQRGWLAARRRAFLACTFWLAQNYALMGRRDEAREVFERLLGLCNDVGLLSEEYDTKAERLVGNFPQAFSHVPLIDTARTLSVEGKAYPRQRRQSAPGSRS